MQLGSNTNTNDVKNRYILLPRETQRVAGALVMVCALVVGFRVLCCCRSPWPPHHLSPIDPLLRTCSRCHSLSVLPIPENKMLLALAVRIGTILAHGKFNPSLTRSSTLCLPPPSTSNPASYRRNRLTVVQPVIAPASAHGHPDRTLLLCRCCLKTTRESEVSVPDAPRTT